MVNKNNKPFRLAWAKKYLCFTVDQWRRRIFSDKTRANMWGSDGGDVLKPHRTKPHMEGDAGDVFS
jgi:hypothetical protein